MKYYYRVLAIVLACIIIPCAQAGDNQFEVQFGAFRMKETARKCVEEFRQLDRPVYISLLRNRAGEQFYTVRTGPFESLEQAGAYLVSVPDSSDRPRIMVKDSLEPVQVYKDSSGRTVESAEYGFSGDDPDPEITMAEAREEEPAPTGDNSSENEASAAEESGGLWGAAGDDPDTGNGEPETDPVPESSPPAEIEMLKQQIDELQDQVRTLLDAEEVRGALEESEDEKEEQEEEILSAAGRNYTLLRKGKLGFEYKFDYSYNAYDAIQESIVIEHHSNHNITNSFTLEYPVRDNFSLEADIPFVFAYDKVGSDDSRDVSDFGDVRFSANYQPVRSGGGFPSIILRTVLTTPMGRSPYDINRETELSTGSGGYALEGSVYLSKAVDPIVVYGSLGYNYKFPIDNLDYKLGSGATMERYERGDTITFALGMAYSLSYTTSLSLGYSYAYTLESESQFKEIESRTYPTQTFSSLSIGTSWRLSPRLLLNVTLGIGLADSNHHSISFRFPFEFDL